MLLEVTMNAVDKKDVPMVCQTCGAVPASETEAKLTWSKAVEPGRPTWCCERCSRENVRSIESKLDPVWW